VATAPQSLRELVNAMRERPAMYLGEPSITRLEAYLNGWLQGGPGHEGDAQELADFTAWLATRHGIPGTQGWARIISFYAGGEQSALRSFFDNFDRFLRSRESINET